MRADYTLPRLYLDHTLCGEIDLSREQAHYFGTVLRKRVGDRVRLFNGRDGEWAAEIVTTDRKSMRLSVGEQLREPCPVPDIRLLFAPLRKHRTSTVLEKATELGVRTIQPVITARTQFSKFNIERANAQITEAAEQTERLDLPDLYAPVTLYSALADNRHLLFADEAGCVPMVLPTLEGLSLPLDVLIGPEGGFMEDERDMIRARDDVYPVTLGPRILRADTAAISLLTLVQAKLGDWQHI
ncbi:ribosomal RNA small subunit methyltransferase E [Algimonas arctica]|uniref:Ribosomal RNA small subunit methyltransferase E n=1 Tax=Algimonas arctica TaxID=1479486 RepID=A0A8J3CRS8_9PROT|nr:16S rRNA (uracil(1498)-N(3))-methyltransferase [Algimonas arctica]GHA91786.1 ribosomal RNA small subunit methyltransferase E [Algimonas arctica]